MGKDCFPGFVQSPKLPQASGALAPLLRRADAQGRSLAALPGVLAAVRTAQRPLNGAPQEADSIVCLHY